MSDYKFKPSFGVETLLSGDLAVESEKFLLFMKAYYEWMQTTKIEITSIVGTFVKGETIISASGATAVVREVVVGELIVQVDSRNPFNLLDGITGQTSLATANISLVRDNVVRKTGKILEYRNLETSIDQYVDYLRDELYPSIPVTYYGDKRAVAARFKELFISKSNEDSYKFLFKLLYNDTIEFYYPGIDILRVSDGNFEKTQIIRTIAISADTRDIFLFLNKTIRGQTSGVLANVVDIKKFFIGSLEIAEMTIKLASGTFTADEEIVDIDDEDLSTTIYGIVSGVTVVDGGSGYEEGDLITITGDGSEAKAKVSSIKESPIRALTVNTIGHGYQLNTEATINNTGTGGTGFLFEVSELANTYTVTSGANTYTVGEISKLSIINRGEGYFKKPTVTLEDTTISSLGLLSNNLITIVNAGSNYGVGNTLIFTGGAGANAAGQIASVVESTSFDLLFEDGFQMISDDSYYDIIKNEDWLVKGPIKRIELTNFGTGYASANLPSITISTSTGSSANLIATNIQGKSANVSIDTSNNITGIGSIRSVEITNFGIDYSAANVSASAVGDGNANLVSVITGIGVKEGVWIDDDGKIDYKIIQDSYYYQDYSYVIKSGLTFKTYSDTLKAIIHPAGLQSFGEILLFSELDLTMLPSSTITTINDINEYLVYIISYVDVDKTTLTILPEVTLKLPELIANTAIVNDKTLTVFQTPDAMLTEVNIANKEYVVIIEDDDIDLSNILVASPTSIELDLDANTTIQTDKVFTVFPFSDIISTELNIDNKEYVVIIEDDGIDLSDISIAASTSVILDLDIVAFYKIGDFPQISYFFSVPILDYAFLNFDSAIIPTKTNTNVILNLSSDTSIQNNNEFIIFPEVIIELPIEANIQDTEYVVIIEDDGINLSDISVTSPTNIEFNLNANTSIQNNNEFKVFQTPDVMLTEVNIDDKEYVVIIEDDDIDLSNIANTSYFTVWEQIQGTISCSTYSYSLAQISTYANNQISALQSATFLSNVNHVTGIGTNLLLDFAVNDTFSANNELGIISLLSSNTEMDIYIAPSSPYTNVSAYKIIAGP